MPNVMIEVRRQYSAQEGLWHALTSTERHVAACQPLHATAIKTRVGAFYGVMATQVAG